MSRHVTGIGGLFFADDHKALAAWYNEPSASATNPTAGCGTRTPAQVFSPFKRDTDYFANDKQQFMLNLRVQDLDGLLKKLEAGGVRIDPKRQDEDYGRFAWVYDRGNKDRAVGAEGMTSRQFAVVSPESANPALTSSGCSPIFLPRQLIHQLVQVADALHQRDPQCPPPDSRRSNR